jgi:hypothetical protein
MVIRRTRITIETEGLFVIRQAGTVSTWCPGCQAQVEVMLLGEDSQVAQLLAELQPGSLHYWGPRESPTRVCLPSLLRCSQPGGIHPSERILGGPDEEQGEKK